MQNAHGHIQHCEEQLEAKDQELERLSQIIADRENTLRELENMQKSQPSPSLNSGSAHKHSSHSNPIEPSEPMSEMEKGYVTRL